MASECPTGQVLSNKFFKIFTAHALTHEIATSSLCFAFSSSWPQAFNEFMLKG